MKFPQFKTEEEALLAISFLSGIGPVLGKNLIQYSGSANAVFELSDHELLKISIYFKN
jgi:ERCC4-type nuclease